MLANAAKHNGEVLKRSIVSREVRLVSANLIVGRENVRRLLNKPRRTAHPPETAGRAPWSLPEFEGRATRWVIVLHHIKGDVAGSKYLTSGHVRPFTLDNASSV